MSQSAGTRQRVTFAEFCDMTPPDDRRYELFDGRIVAMNQPSGRHAFLTGSLIRTLGNALASRCHVVGPMGIYVEATDDGFAPDVIVTCEPARYDPIRGRALVNPRALFEILSPSTEHIDKTLKVSRYTTLPSLQEYVLVSQNEKHVQIYRRGHDRWTWQRVESGTFAICEAEIPIDAIYGGIDDFPIVEPPYETRVVRIVKSPKST
ncbi:Uma2 family endonuclease [Pendulispora rubella]|uniref:Uma2 family endonuclease n=1 Tax=Pendulispora rubella TaxID=2741070 RepID=A0ABZ2LCH0_9BACT